MHLEILLDKIKAFAQNDEEFKQRLIAAYEGDNPIVNLCRVCNAAGIEIYPMDIADAGESAYAAMRRSTNGGGENSPHLTWTDDVIENLIRELGGKHSGENEL